METDSMRAILADIFENPNTPEHFKEKYPDFFEMYPTLSEKVFEASFDKSTMLYMLEQKQKMEANKQTEYDSSVKVGTLLVDKFVKPDFPPNC